MTITTSRQGDHVLITNLIGQLIDQTSLVEVLNALYDMHLSIISVECLEQESEARYLKG